VTELTKSYVHEGAEALCGRFDEEGYLYLPGLVPAEAVQGVRADFLGALGKVGWIADGPPGSAVPTERARREPLDPDPAFFEGYIELQRLQSFHELPYRPELMEVSRILLQDEVLCHPRKIARAALPKDFVFMTAPHQDYRLIQGTGDVLTLWMPMGDCPDDLGGLAVLSGSHRLGLLEVTEAPGVGGLKVDIPADFDSPDLDWRVSEMAAGDVLVFHSLTVHSAKPNLMDSLRLSADFRYQSVNEPLVPGALGPHGAPYVPEYDELTRGWTSTASVDAPPGVKLAEPFDVFAPGIPTPPSRILSLAGV
jgi:hypothetical protein